MTYVVWPSKEARLSLVERPHFRGKYLNVSWYHLTACKFWWFRFGTECCCCDSSLLYGNMSHTNHTNTSKYPVECVALQAIWSLWFCFEVSVRKIMYVSSLRNANFPVENHKLSPKILQSISRTTSKIHSLLIPGNFWSTFRSWFPLAGY